MLLRWSFAIGLLAAVTGFAARPDVAPAPIDGNWIVAYSASPTSESRQAIVKIETADGKPTATVLHTGPVPKGRKAREFKLTDLTASKGSIAFTLDDGFVPMAFAATADPKDAKRFVGTVTIDKRTVYRATFAATEKLELAAGDMFTSAKAPPPIAELQKLNAAPFPLRLKANKSEDKAEKKALLAEAKALAKVATDASPKLYRETIATAPESPHSVVAADYLIGKAETISAKPEEVEAWWKLIEAEAKPYGPKFSASTALRLGDTLSVQTGYEALAAKLLERGLSDASQTPTRRVSGYAMLAACLDVLGRDREASVARGEVVKLDAVLDADYKTSVPPFAVAKYAGRTDKAANRVAVLELFTGAQCPPCVAADVAFDAALKAYGPTDVVLLQYHLHVPRPDPLTGPDSIARMDFYKAAFPEKVVGATPTLLINGKPADGAAQSGGSMKGSATKFDAYRKAIDAALEQTTDVKIVGTSRESGNELTATVDVSGLKAPAKTVKLRLVVVEADVKYVGSNGIRFHHHVVRSLFDKPEGVAVDSLKSGHYEAKLNLADLKVGLEAYLTKFQTAEGRFPRNDKPVALKGLKVFALIQDDATGELLQAAQLTATMP